MKRHYLNVLILLLVLAGRAATASNVFITNSVGSTTGYGGAYISLSPNGTYLLLVDTSSQTIKLTNRYVLGYVPWITAPDYLTWRHDGKEFIVGDHENAIVVSAAHLRVIETIRNATCCWWQDNSIFYTTATSTNGDLVTPSLSKGEMLTDGKYRYQLPRHMVVTAATAGGVVLMAQVTYNGDFYPGHICFLTRSASLDYS